MVQHASIYSLDGGRTPAPGPLARLKAALMVGVLIVIGAVVLAGILAIGLVLIPFVLLTAIVGWVIIRRRIRQAIRAMESPNQDSAGRENVRVRRGSEGSGAEDRL